MTPIRWLLLAAVLVLTSAWLATDSPEIDDTSRGDDYTCAAPYDTVLLGADNVPGGEPATDADAIAERCTAAGRTRFAVAGAMGAVALLAVGGAVVSSGGGSPRRRTTTSVEP